MPSDDGARAVDDSGEARQLLAVATNVIGTASRLVRSHTPQTVSWKGDRDVTTDVDFAVEKLVRDLLHKHTPNAGFLGEEEGGGIPGEGLHWVLDPIDGTVNLVHDAPLCAISLSLVRDGEVVAAVIELPFLNTQYTALLGQGSYANDRKLHVSATTNLDAALVSVDQYTFGEAGKRKNNARHRLISNLFPHVQRIRMLGTSAIDLAWTAQGRLERVSCWGTSLGIQVQGFSLHKKQGQEYWTWTARSIRQTRRQL